MTSADAVLELTLASLLKLLHHRRDTCTVRIACGDAQGEVHVQRGHVLHAELEGLTGSAALTALLHLPKPHYRVERTLQPVERTIYERTSQLLSVAMAAAA